MKWASFCAVRLRQSLPNDRPVGPAIPLARWAGRQLLQLAEETGSQRIAALSGESLLGDRAVLNDFTIPGRQSAGGGCCLYETIDGWIALNLARPDDRTLLPALFGDASLNPHLDADIRSAFAAFPSTYLLAQGRDLGLAIASTEEKPTSPHIVLMVKGQDVSRGSQDKPLVVDLSALWAGPLAGHLLWLAGADVVKVESRSRPDAMRKGDPALFALLNQGKASGVVDISTEVGREALTRLLRRADIVIEAARPRALHQLGIDADDIIDDRPGLVWLTITGHGVSGAAAEWVGFGDDCGVAGKLSSALAQVSGAVGFVGDAVADPLTGILAAREAWRHWRGGNSSRIGFSMSSIVSLAVAEEQARDPNLLRSELAAWTNAAGNPFPDCGLRVPEAALRPLGADTEQWLVDASC